MEIVKIDSVVQVIDLFPKKVLAFILAGIAQFSS